MNKLSKKQEEILNLIYRFRFLSRTQIQKLLNHNDPSRINKWLLSLVQIEFIGRIYMENTTDNRVPSIYYLDKKGVTYIKKLNSIDNSYMQKIYNEEKVSTITQTHSIKAADIYILLNDYATKNNHILKYYTKAELADMPLSKYLRPDSYFTYETPIAKKNAFIEIDMETETKATFRKKIKKYIDYYYTFKWTVPYKDTFPFVDIICITEERREVLIKELEIALTDYDIPLTFKITTFSDIENSGIDKRIWTMPFEKSEKYKIM